MQTDRPVFGIAKNGQSPSSEHKILLGSSGQVSHAIFQGKEGHHGGRYLGQTDGRLARALSAVRVLVALGFREGDVTRIMWGIGNAAGRNRLMYDFTFQAPGSQP